MRTSPDLADVTSDLQVDNPQANVVVDRDKASALGVTPQEVENALYSAYGQRLVSPIYTANNEYWVVLQVQDRFQRDPGHALGAVRPIVPGPARATGRRLAVRDRRGPAHA